MEKALLKKEITIHAPKQKVWNVLLQDKYTRIWYASFMEGSYAISDWKTGSKVSFLDNDANGVFGKIAENKPFEKLSIQYEGIIINKMEDYTSDDAKEWQSASETYLLTEKNDQTSLTVELDVPPKYMKEFDSMWNKALQKIKTLAEEK